MNPVRLPHVVRDAVEEEIESLQFAPGVRREDPVPVPIPGRIDAREAQPVSAPSGSYGDDYRRFADLMQTLFPGGFRLEQRDDFAVFFLFERMLESLFHFSQTGMTDEHRIRDVSEYAAAIKRMLTHDHEA